MTSDEPVAPPSNGEQRHRARLRAFVRYSAVVMLVAISAGVVSGYVGGMVRDGRLPPWLIYGTAAATAVGFLWFLRDYLRRVDELDRLDTLWAGFVGFTVFYVAFPTWNLLAGYNLAPAVDHWWLWIGTTIVMFAAYLLRKAGVR